MQCAMRLTEWIIFIFSVAAIASVRSTLPPSSSSSSPLHAPLSTRPLNISNFAIFAGVAPTSLISLDARLKFFTSFSITSVGHSFVVSQIFALLIKYLKKKHTHKRWRSCPSNPVKSTSWRHSFLATSSASSSQVGAATIEVHYRRV